MIAVSLPFWEMAIGHRTGMWGDIPAAYVPRYIAVWGNLREGQSPNWWRAFFGGFNTLGAGQSGVLYLPNLVFGWLSAVNAYRIWFFAHLWLMAAGWFFWSWRRWNSTLGAGISGVAGVLNGYVIYHTLFMPFFAALALLPWAFLLLDLLVQRRDRRSVAMFALVLGGIVICGLPQLLWLLLIVLGVYALTQLLNKAVPLSVWFRVCSGFAIGVALGTVQLLPLFRHSQSSVRPKLDKEAAFALSASPKHLLTLLFPNALGGGNSGLGWHSPWLGGELQHEVANYLGITFLALAVVGVFRLRRSPLVIGIGTLAVFGLLSALGGRTPVGDLAYHVLPLASRFRAWSRNELWLNIAVAMLAGAGAREVQRSPRRTGLQIFVAAGSLSLLSLLLRAVTNLRGSLVEGVEGVASFQLPLLLLALLGLSVLLIARWSQPAKWLLATVCVVDLVLFSFASPWRSQSLPRDLANSAFSADQPIFGPVTDQPGGLDRWASDIPDASRLWPTALGYPGSSVNGYDPLILSDYSDTLGYMAYNGYLPDPRLWSGGWMPDVLRTTTLLASGYAGAPAPGWTAYGTFDIYTLYSYSPRLAESYLVGDVRIGSLDEARAALMDSGTDLTQYAYVDRGTVNTSLDRFAGISRPGASGAVISGAMGDGGSGTWTVFAERPSLFVTSYAWMEGWHATVDGQPVPVARTNALVLGVPVPAGSHRVRLTFTPPGWTAGRNISILALVIVVGLFLSDISRQRWARLARSVRTAGKQKGATGAEPMRGGVKVFTDRAD